MESPDRWFGTGHCAGPDPQRAGREAARRALRGPDPALLIVFTSRLSDPAAVLGGIAEVCPDVPLIGCSSELLVTDEHDALHGVTVTALGGPGFTVRTGVGSCAGGAQRSGGAAVARAVTDSEDGTADSATHRILLLLTDGSVADQEEIIAGAYRVVGASVPLIGGSASPDGSLGRPFQLHGDQVLHDAVVAAMITSNGPLGIGIGHGWRKVGEPLIVTRSVKGDVHTLDDRPALPTYLDRFGAPAETYTDPEAFEVFARSRPIGVRRHHGEEVRSVSSSTGLSAGRLRASGEVPEGGLVWLMEGDTEAAVAAACDACRDAVAALGGARPLGVLAFDCVSRAHMLGVAGTRREVDQMIEESGGAPVAVLYTLGEIARIRGMNGYHNQTLAILAVG